MKRVNRGIEEIRESLPNIQNRSIHLIEPATNVRFSCVLLLSLADARLAPAFQGLYKSTDSGASWTPMNQGLDEIAAAHTPVNALVLDPDRPNILFLATSGYGVSRQLVLRVVCTLLFRMELLFGRERHASTTQTTKARYLSLRSRPAKGREPIEVRIPVRDLANELNEQLPTAAVYQDLPRGRKRSGWKREFTRTLESAAKDLSGVTESQIADAIRGYRAGKKTLPEITIGPPNKTA